MGELSFKYDVIPVFRHETGFQYLYSDLIEYSFAYQRYVALSDASIFNSPVAITKVATGLSDLHDLFAERNTYTMLYKHYLPIGYKEKSNAFDTKEINVSDKEANANADKIVVAGKNEITGNKFKLLFGSKGIAYASVIRDALAEPYGLYAEYSNILSGIPDRKDTIPDKNEELRKLYNTQGNVHKAYSLYRKNDDNLHCNKGVLGHVSDKVIDKINNLFAKRLNDDTLSKFDIVSGKASNKKVNSFIEVAVELLNLFKTQDLGITPCVIANENIGVIQKQVFSKLKSLDKKLFLEDTVFGSAMDRDAYSYITLSMGKKVEQPVFVDYNNAFGVKYQKNAGTSYDNLYVLKYGKPVFTTDNMYSISRSPKDSFILDLETFQVIQAPTTVLINGVDLDSAGKPVFTSNNTSRVFKGGKETQIDDVLYKTKKRHKHVKITKNARVTKGGKSFEINEVNVYISKSGKVCRDIYKTLCLIKDKKDTMTKNHLSFISKIGSHMSLDKNGHFVIHSSKDVRIEDTVVFATKDNKAIRTELTGSFVNKRVKDIIIKDNSIFVDKFGGQMTITYDPQWSFKFAKSIFLEGSRFVKKELKELSIKDSELWTVANGRLMFVKEDVFVDSAGKLFSIWNDDIYIQKGIVNIAIDNLGTLLYKELKQLYLLDNNIAINAPGKSIVIGQNDVWLNKTKYQLGINALFKLDKHVKSLVLNNYHALYRVQQNTAYFGQIQALNGRLKFSFEQPSIWMGKDKKELFITSEHWMEKSKKELFITSGRWLEKDKKELSIVTGYWVDKNKKDIYVFLDNIGVSKSSIGKGMFFDKEEIWVDKKIGFSIMQQSYPLIKDSHSIVIYDPMINFLKSNSGINYPFEGLWLNKTLQMSTLENLLLEKDSHMAHIFQQGQAIIKEKMKVVTLDFESVLRNDLPCDFANSLHHSFPGMLVPVSKAKRQSYIDYIDRMASKFFKKLYINQSTSASIIKHLNVPLTDMFCDKPEHKVFIDYMNLQATKKQLHSTINNDPIVAGITKIIQMNNQSVTAEICRRIWLEKEVIISGTHKDLSVNCAVITDVEQKEMSINKWVNASRETRKTELTDLIFVDKPENLCYYDYGMTWMDKDTYLKIEQQQIFVQKDANYTHILDCVSPCMKDSLKGFYEFIIFGNKDMYQSELFQQLHSIHKVAYDANILPNDYENWAWVYEDPDPFQGDQYGIDELLLPEVDTRYEDFEDIIFDKENMRPRYPIKEIDETTFVAKYPIRHPITKYSNIGIDYDKSAVKVENYYGIETSIMHEIYLKFYQIWKSKIFEFGSMSMTQAVEQMLKYLYSWIIGYFAPDQLEQALRVFRQIRWYGETSIIQNSQYIVSYEYDDLKSLLTSGACKIPNDLDTNPTMIVDGHLGVIKANPAYVGISEASVTFMIENKKNSTFTFSLSNTIGSVNIYINGILVDTVSHSALNLTYPLPYTGDTNIVKIEKPAHSNLNGTFYIGNIIVPNCSFKNLSIEFDPVLRLGNKPLDEIAKKIVAYANLYEDREYAYTLMRKGNLGISETYKHLVEYWNLHHQDKIKGKRLTIKEI